MRRTTSITASLALAACLPDGHWKERGPTEPAALADGWEIATPESVGLDPAVLGAIHEDLLREDRNFGTLAFLVVKDGKLVFETYLQTPSDRDVAHHVQSVTESVTSLALGIAHDDGLLPDLDATLGELLPSATFDGLDPQKREISLRHLLTMSSGLDMDNDTFSWSCSSTDRPTRCTTCSRSRSTLRLARSFAIATLRPRRQIRHAPWSRAQPTAPERPSRIGYCTRARRSDTSAEAADPASEAVRWLAARQVEQLAAAAWDYRSRHTLPP